MSKLFYATRRSTGERWKPEPNTHSFLVMYDSGYLAAVYDHGWDGYAVVPLDPKIWQFHFKNSIKKLVDK